MMERDTFRAGQDNDMLNGEDYNDQLSGDDMVFGGDGDIPRFTTLFRNKRH